ncbi:hypothetical protein [Streptomyces sp. NBC_00162]|uniref:scabin-related ADP-ribosyltransferase n=1 Tax=Streptomyces sp. NBC_00162 TaxID=2903629 RepID=UPI00214C20AF|nr:hypothetical protein [Streptomyces sp. NBC_00162]UUU40257.1 hypothetical protein JIW86_16445 [Streptomyces sp. NBC_00162]
MSGDAPVDPAEIPVFTGDLAVLDEKVKAISSGGAAVSTKASDVHTSFGGIQAFYQAPEADQLFATTKPVSDLGLKLSSDMCTIAGALGTYSRDAAPVIKKLEKLRADAQAFREKTDKDEKWREDGDLIDENLDRRNKIADVWEEFHDVEKAAHAKIVALVGGKPLKTDDGSHGEGMYGYDAEALKQSKSLPWGDAVEESIPGWQFWEHGWEFTKGFFVDGVWGTLKGLGGLVGLQGWDTFKQSWTGLAKLGTGLGIAMMPGVGPLFMAIPDDKLPSYLRESRNAMKETGKALLAWDQWGSNPGRAAGAVTFNVITTIATGGTGGAVSGAGKAGAIAKALSLAGKAGRVVDPMTYIMKGAGAGFTKAGDVMAALKGMGNIDVKIADGAFAMPGGSLKLPDGSIQLPKGTAIPDGAIKLPDGNIKLPEGTATLPPGTVKLPFDGEAKYLDPDGNYYKEDGSLHQTVDEGPVEKVPATKPGADVPKLDTPVKVEVPDRVLETVGGPAGDGVHLGSNISDPVHAADHTPGTHPDTAPGGMADNGVHNSHSDPTPTGGGSHATDTTPTGGATHTDTPSTGGGHGDGPSTGGGHGGGGDAGDGAGGPGAGAADGGEPNRLAAATDDSVDLDQLGMPVVWRTDDAPLYRSDNRKPEDIFESGFEPLDPSSVDLRHYVEESDNSAFISTSYRDDIGEDFGGKYTYEVDLPGGIDVNTSMGPHPLDYEMEIAFPGGIRPEYIKGARPYNYATGEMGDLIPNPNYRPEAERVP